MKHYALAALGFVSALVWGLVELVAILETL